MRDIRPDLLERLKHVDDELRAVDARRHALVAEQESLRTMVASEDKRWGGLAQKALPLNGQGTADTNTDRTTLSIVMGEELGDRKRHHLKDLSDAAQKRGYPFGDKKPGRVIHFALLGMWRAGLVDRLGGGYWKIRENAGH